MSSGCDRTLLTAQDAQPVRITNRRGLSEFLFLDDHSGNPISVKT